MHAVFAQRPSDDRTLKDKIPPRPSMRWPSGLFSENSGKITHDQGSSQAEFEKVFNEDCKSDGDVTADGNDTVF